MRPIADKLAEVDIDSFSIDYDVPGKESVTLATVAYHGDLMMDIYYPPGFDFRTKLPVVVFVFGFTNVQMQGWFGLERLRDLGQYPTLAQVVAAQGMIAVTYDVAFADDDLDYVLDYLAGNARRLGVDASRMALWTCSNNARTALRVLADEEHPHAGAFRCGVVAYPVLHEYIGFGNPWPPALPHRPREDVPIFFVKVDEANEEWNGAVDAHLGLIDPLDVPLEVIYHEGMPHGFDANPSTRTSTQTREVLDRMLAFNEGSPGGLKRPGRAAAPQIPYAWRRVRYRGDPKRTWGGSSGSRSRERHIMRRRCRSCRPWRNSTRGSMPGQTRRRPSASGTEVSSDPWAPLSAVVFPIRTSPRNYCRRFFSLCGSP
jgi:hypothetical protein